MQTGKTGAALGDELMVPKDTGPAGTLAGQPPAASALGFRAFISYSHCDTKIAEWLHRSIETYRVPKALIGRITGTGEIGPRPGKIFRDRDELEVAADLSGKINEALQQSQFLIVVCSPASARSKWVNQEVINFKRLKGAERIIAVIAAGEPSASTFPGREAEECFVPALRFKVSPKGELTDEPAEPIAADLRPGKDPKAKVRIKVIAGLLGVGLDELIRRDNARRQKFTAYAMAASLAGMAVMTGLAWSAMAARDDAERQKVQAEDLIEFMLGDLRQKLEPVGRLDVLDSVGERALQYFKTLRPDELDAATLGRRARALHLLGEIEDLRGELDRSRATFEEAARTTAELLGRVPENPEWLFNHAESVYFLGYSSEQKGDLVAARRNYEERKKLAERLVTQAPNQPKWILELAEADQDLGFIIMRMGQAAEAIAHFSSAVAESRRLLELEPTNVLARKQLAMSQGSRADAFYSLGQLRESESERKEVAETYRTWLKDDPQNRTVQSSLMITLRSIGLVALDRGETDDALRWLTAANEMGKELTRFDSANTAWAEYLVRTDLDLADIFYDRRSISECRTSLVTARKGIAALIAKEPQRVKWQLLLRIRATLIEAKLALLTADFDSTYAAADDVADFLTANQANFNKEASFSGFLGQAIFLKGEARRGQGNLGEARANWQEALPWLKESKGYYPLESHLFEARTLWRLGQDSALQTIFSGEDLKEFGRADYRDLQGQVTAPRTKSGN